MSDYEKNIDKIRKYFEEHKAELYPFENALLSEKDEYVKSLYFRMLCTLTRYTGEPSEMQVLYIRRLLAGSHAESEFEDYMKMALDLDKGDIDEFMSIFAEDELRYYFCIDGSILLSAVKADDKNYELLAELVELLGINRKELSYIVSVAKAIITQDSELFDETKEIAPQTTKQLSMYHYVQAFYAGAIVDTSERLHIYSCEKAEVDLSKYSPIKAKKVIVENVLISLKADVFFENCEEVIFLNTDVKVNDCRLGFKNVVSVMFENALFENGKQYPIMFNHCGKIQMYSCRFRNFISRTIQEENVANFSISKSSFDKCEYQYSRDTEDWKSFGGVIFSNSPGSNGTNYFDNCTFVNCGGRNTRNYYSSDFISNCRSELTACTFKLCWHYRQGNELDPDDRRRRMFTSNSKAIDCISVNSAKIVN